MSEKRTEIGKIGEFGLIDKIKGSATYNHEKTLHGIGDDAAVIAAADSEMVITSDMLNEGIHFDLSYMPLTHLGYKAVSVNVSDIAAMNAVPRHITVSLGLSNRFSVEAVEALYSGIHAACEDYNIDIIGGDTTSSASGLIISITAIGEVKSEKKAMRFGAKNGDIVCVSGDLGAAFLGLQVLEREKQVFQVNPKMQPKLKGYEYLLERQMKPKARTDIIHELSELKVIPTSMIDISDGLASEILHLSKASQVGFKIFEENLPMDGKAYDTAVEFQVDTVTCMLNGGEDYELLFTVAKADKEKLEKHRDIHFIGTVQELASGNELISKNKRSIPISAQGFQHFSKGQKD